MKTGRNDPCPCGSGKKYKKCCLDETPSAKGPGFLSPAELVAARRRAFDGKDFGFIYDSYHPESPFRHQFPTRQEYLVYARTSLEGAIRIRECRILREEQITEDEARVLFYLDIMHEGQRHESVELSRFVKRGSGWLYFSGLKVARCAFPGALEDIEPEEVERLSEGISI